MNFDRNKVERVRRQYPVGTRIQLHSLCNNERDMPPGLCGTVVGVDDQPSLLMKWDNGRGLSLMPFEDSFTVIQEQQHGMGSNPQNISANGVNSHLNPGFKANKLGSPQRKGSGADIQAKIEVQVRSISAPGNL